MVAGTSLNRETEAKIHQVSFYSRHTYSSLIRTQRAIRGCKCFMPAHGHKHMKIDTWKHKCLHLLTTPQQSATQQGTTRNSLDGPSQWSPSPSSCLAISLFLHWRRWCLCQAGARRPHKAREDVTTNKNSIVTPRNLIRSHWFMLWMETEYLESGSSKGGHRQHDRGLHILAV